MDVRNVLFDASLFFTGRERPQSVKKAETSFAVFCNRDGESATRDFDGHPVGIRDQCMNAVFLGAYQPSGATVDRSGVYRLGIVFEGLHAARGGGGGELDAVQLLDGILFAGGELFASHHTNSLVFSHTAMAMTAMIASKTRPIAICGKGSVFVISSSMRMKTILHTWMCKSSGENQATLRRV